MQRYTMILSTVVFLLISSSFALSADNLREIDSSQIKIGGSLEVPLGKEVENAVAVGGSVTVLGHVKEDAVAVGGSVHLGPNAKVDGDAISIGGKITKDEGAVIAGEIVEISPFSISPVAPQFSWKEIAPILVALKLLTFLGFLGMALLAALLIPKPLGTISFYLEENFIRSFVIGFIGFILFVPIVVLMVISIIGIIFVPVFIFIFLLALVLGYISASQMIGKRIAERFKNLRLSMMLEITLGLVILTLLGLVPVLGWFLQFLVAAAGLGGVLSTRFGTEVKS